MCHSFCHFQSVTFVAVPDWLTELPDLPMKAEAKREREQKVIRIGDNRNESKNKKNCSYLLRSTIKTRSKEIILCLLLCSSRYSLSGWGTALK